MKPEPASATKQGNRVILYMDDSQAGALVSLLGRCVSGGVTTPMYEALAALHLPWYKVDTGGNKAISVVRAEGSGRELKAEQGG